MGQSSPLLPWGQKSNNVQGPGEGMGWAFGSCVQDWWFRAPSRGWGPITVWETRRGPEDEHCLLALPPLPPKLLS